MMLPRSLRAREVHSYANDPCSSRITLRSPVHREVKVSSRLCRYHPAKQRLAKMEDQLRLLTAGQTGYHIMNTPNPPPPAGETVGLTALKKPNIANTVPSSFSAVCAESQTPLPPNLATQDLLPASQPTELLPLREWASQLLNPRSGKTLFSYSSSLKFDFDPFRLIPI